MASGARDHADAARGVIAAMRAVTSSKKIRL
jgi:hypothetical protein